MTPERQALIRQVVNAMPPLTPEQRARLRPILSGTLAAPEEGGADAAA